MAGYNGWSMSNNAVEAYESGEKPLSKWTKTAIFEAISGNSDYNFNSDVISALKKMPVKALKELVLERTSWHHTSNHYNKTNFYSVDFDLIEELTTENLEILLKSAEADKKNESPKDIPEIWECTFLEWSGTRKHPKATEITEIGEIKGNWFYRTDGSKKSINANGFRKIKKIGKISREGML